MTHIVCYNKDTEENSKSNFGKGENHERNYETNESKEL